MSKQRRYPPDVRRELILSTACALAADGVPYYRLTREQIARAAGLSGTALQYHFGPIALLRQAALEYAVQHEMLPVIAQALAVRDPTVRELPDRVRQRAAEYLTR